MQKHQVAFVSRKQGVGKTALGRHLGEQWSRSGLDVFACDWDEETHRLLELEGRRRHSFRSANGNSLEQDIDADIAVIDVEGGLEEAKAKALAGSDLILVPTSLSDKDKKAMGATVRWLHALGVAEKNILVVFNNISRDADSQEAARQARIMFGYMGVRVAEASVGNCPTFETLEERGYLATDVDDPASKQLASEYAALAQEVWGMLSGA
jgi:cellulose biosynthesis protein BcsQ